MDKTKLNDTFRLCKVQDLKVGLKYVIVLAAHYDDNPKKVFKHWKDSVNAPKDYFLVQTVRKGLSVESIEEYEKYKNYIKKMVKDKQIWIQGI